MGFRFKFNPLQNDPTNDQKRKYQALKEKYSNKVYLSPEELVKDKEELDKELEKDQGLDIGAHKDYAKKQAERYAGKQAEKAGPEAQGRRI